ncbi:hypothetical protein [Actinokineospora globicatena]|uniref:hypothetical protein n=1 Tax=Actinokineospora globicatena TaxID=103729 RepID=UPI0025573686|nr:hypothetical protein [Actinokineospora globicatena]
MRSIPEKTLEHWASAYLTNRFPNGALWWPTSGEDVLAQLPRLATSRPGKTLALELKTTEADHRGNHVLSIDTDQLKTYLNPPSGIPLPVYYVFPTPFWTGSLTSHSANIPSGSAQIPPPAHWWRRRGGQAWFGNWLYVLPAHALAAALPHGWSAPHRNKATLFTVNRSHLVHGIPDWPRLLSQAPATRPLGWTQFWKDVPRCGPHNGVRWRTLANDNARPTQMLLLEGTEEQTWMVDDLLGLRWSDTDPDARRSRDVEEVGDVGAVSAERLLLQVPDSSLK